MWNAEVFTKQDNTVNAFTDLECLLHSIAILHSNAILVHSIYGYKQRLDYRGSSEVLLQSILFH